uniref:Transcobalamin 1 n=1 Tax=Equus asinus asinus TaxID=83772 RepID=A0A8C4LI09_EQUAS
MRQSHQLPLVGLLLFSLIPSQLCEICEVSKGNYFRLQPLISTMISSNNTRGIQASNVLLSLRLVGIQKQDIEQQLIQQIEENVKSRSSDLTSGQVALIILALGECQNPDERFIYDNNLVSQLETKFQAEVENMGAHNCTPLTNYYQLSLDVLALCLFNGNYSIRQVAELFNPENKNYYFSGQFSVDTGAMAVLALTCVERKGQIETDGEYLNHIKKKKKMVSLETDLVQEKLLFKEISQGAFSIPIAAAQILPALVGKTYLDINKDSPCPKRNFNSPTPKPTSERYTNSPSNILVHYSVKINRTYSTNVAVLNGSVFLNVMEAAREKNETIFRFTVEESSWGPYITSVQGLKANNNDRTYWQLLSEGKPLSQGKGEPRGKGGSKWTCWPHADSE